MKRTLIHITIITVSLSFAIATFADTPKIISNHIGTVADDTELRAGPSIFASVIKKARTREEYEYSRQTTTDGHYWYEVIINRKKAWIDGSYFLNNLYYRKINGKAVWKRNPDDYDMTNEIVHGHNFSIFNEHENEI